MSDGPPISKDSKNIAAFSKIRLHMKVRPRPFSHFKEIVNFFEFYPISKIDQILSDVSPISRDSKNIAAFSEIRLHMKVRPRPFGHFKEIHL